MATVRKLTVAISGLAVIGLGLSHLAWGTTFSQYLPVLVVAAVVGELIRLPRQGGRATALSLAAVAAGALVGVSSVELAILAALSWVVQTIVVSRSGRRPRAVDLANRLAGAVALGVMTGAANHLTGDGLLELGEMPSLLSLVVVWLTVLLMVPLVDHLELTVLAGDARPRRVRDAVVSGLPGGLTIAATGTLAVMVYTDLQYATIPLLVVPLIASKRGLDRYETMRRATSQTIRAMSRLPEHVGAVETGHGVRAGQRAQSIATRLRLPWEVAEQIERAAVLHAVGRLREKDHPGLSDHEAAVAGADIIREAGDLDQVAAIVMASHEAALLPELALQVDPDQLILAGAIVRASCLWDSRDANELVGDHSLPLVVRDVIMQIEALSETRGLVAAARR